MAFSTLESQAPRSTPPLRTHACTHSHMTRLFDVYGCDQCSLCHRKPSFGWLYRCTQDLGHLPASDFYDVEDTLTKPEQDARIYTLSPSISQAIVDGHYTDVEVLRLVQQKEYVRQAILEQRPNISSHSMSTISTFTTLPESPTSSSISSSSTGIMHEICFDPMIKRPLAPIEEVQKGEEECLATMPVQAPTMTKSIQILTVCNFKVCHTCRPVYRDRAWASINTILSSSPTHPPQHEFNNRRVSDATTVRTMTGSQQGMGNCGLQQGEIDSNKSKRSSKAEFQDTVRRMLRNSQFFGQDEDDDIQISCADHIDSRSHETASANHQAESQAVDESASAKSLAASASSNFDRNPTK